LRTLAIGGLVHDIGKLSIPDTILQKPGAERRRARGRPPASGSRLLQELGGFSPAARRLVHDYHERLDGSGYPRGLTADQPDLKTRIMAVCDVFDALISPRVYRPAWTHDEAGCGAPPARERHVLRSALRRRPGAGPDPRMGPDRPRAAAAASRSSDGRERALTLPSLVAT
jgi:response regulator RpfG family c-di-GMP phosphodiesterase